jgi:hypothetical protein
MGISTEVLTNSTIVNIKVGNITKGDIDVIRHICLPYKVAAPHFGIEPTTLQVRINRLMIVFGVENRAALAIKAIHLKLIKAEDFWVRDYANTKDISGKNN